MCPQLKSFLKLDLCPPNLLPYVSSSLCDIDMAQVTPSISLPEDRFYKYMIMYRWSTEGWSMYVIITHVHAPLFVLLNPWREGLDSQSRECHHPPLWCPRRWSNMISRDQWWSCDCWSSCPCLMISNSQRLGYMLGSRKKETIFISVLVRPCFFFSPLLAFVPILFI